MTRLYAALAAAAAGWFLGRCARQFTRLYREG